MPGNSQTEPAPCWRAVAPGHSLCTFHIQALCTQWLHPLQRPFQAQLHLQEPDLPDRISVLRDDGSEWQVASRPATSPRPSFLLLFILQSGSNEQLGVLVALESCSVLDIAPGIKPCEDLSHQPQGCEGRPGSKGKAGEGRLLVTGLRGNLGSHVTGSVQRCLVREVVAPWHLPWTHAGEGCRLGDPREAELKLCLGGR